MKNETKKTHAGPVTLVVRRSQYPRAKTLSWVFSSEGSALGVAKALRDDCWMVVRGAFTSAGEAVDAAHQGRLLHSQGVEALTDGSGFYYRADLELAEKQASSA